MTVERPEFLAAPGPTEVPPDVLQAQAREVLYHRGPRFGGQPISTGAAPSRFRRPGGASGPRGLKRSYGPDGPTGQDPRRAIRAVPACAPRRGTVH